MGPRVRAHGRPPQLPARGRNDRFFIQHIQAPDQAAKLAQRGEAIYGRPPEFVSEMGPVIGAHAGPGLIGVTALPTSCSAPS